MKKEFMTHFLYNNSTTKMNIRLILTHSISASTQTVDGTHELSTQIDICVIQFNLHSNILA